MLGRRVLLVAALAFRGSQAGALPVHVALDWPAGMPASAPEHARIQAIWKAGPANNGVPVEVNAEAGPDGVVLDLGDGVWQVQASAPGYWSQGTDVVVGRQAPGSVRLAFWPAASLHGKILTAGGEPLPETVEVRLSSIPDNVGETSAPQAPVPRPEPSPSSAELSCRVDQETWSCQGPAGLFDVQLEAAGYVPRYEWGLSLKAAESADLGRTELRRTGSVFGRAVRKDGSNPPGPCQATLQADVERRGGPGSEPESAPQGETSFSVPLTERGYFQVVGVQPGRHVLAVECQAASGFLDLRVQADSETRIDPPLPLEELTLDIAVTPKVDPEGRPWQLTVDATAPRLRQIADKATTSADGRWVRRGLTAGSYRVTVNSSDGTPWPQRYFELGAGSGPLSLHLAFVRVAGRVTLGIQPVRGRLVFSSDTLGEPATLTSDDHGSFQGLLPVESDVQETIWTVEAHGAQPPINRRLEGVSVPSVAGGATAWLELALPTIAVRGTVVSEEGQPQHGVQVTFEDAGRARTDATTDDAGSFELPNLPPGKYTVVAESDEGVSERTTIEVVEGSESELKLILKPSKSIPFYVVSSQGPVADAAVQVWIAPGTPRSFTRTDQDGKFEVKLPTGITEVGLTVGAPGYALKLTRLPISSESDVPPDANTITLDASGGTLELNFQPPGRALDSPATPYLVHDGAIEFAGALADWGSNQAGAIGNGSSVVEAIEPGVYALCLLADPSELAALWLGALPPDRCRKGSVERGRTLTLSPR